MGVTTETAAGRKVGGVPGHQIVSPGSLSGDPLDRILYIFPAQREGTKQEILIESRNRDMIQEIQKDRDCSRTAEVLRREIEERGHRVSCHKAFNTGERRQVRELRPSLRPMAPDR